MIAIDREREIGKVLMVINIIRVENDRSCHNGFSHVSIEDLSEWADMDRDMINSIYNACARLDRRNLMIDAAWSFAHTVENENEQYMLGYAYYSYKANGAVYLLDYESGSTKEHCRMYAKDNYLSFIGKHENYELNDRFGTQGEYCRMMDCFVDFFVNTVREVREEGFPWDVINEMLFVRISKSSFDRISESVSNQLLHRGKQ